MKPSDLPIGVPYNQDRSRNSCPSVGSPLRASHRVLSHHNSMPTRNLYLPNGQRLIVQPVFGGFSFKSSDVNVNSNLFPAGWTVILQTEPDSLDKLGSALAGEETSGLAEKTTRHISPYRHPTLQHDNLFVSSITNPSSIDFQSQTNPTRQIAMMLWVSLYWYFHEEEPSPYLSNVASKDTPNAGKPRGEWRINIKREGVLRGRRLMLNLERMGLIMSVDSSVGLSPSDNDVECWSNMFTSRRAFWQIHEKLFLSTPAPSCLNSLFPGSPYGSRPNSPVWGEAKNPRDSGEINIRHSNANLLSQQYVAAPALLGSFSSAYYPPAPLQYMMTSGVRHPLRPKPPRQGEVFYSRYIPSVGQYLSFRTASLSDKPITANGPVSGLNSSSHQSHYSVPSFSSPTNFNISHNYHETILTVPMHISASSDAGSPFTPTDHSHTPKLTDLELLHKWMNLPRVSRFWGCDGPLEIQQKFLCQKLSDQHSFPVIGLWDGKPFGYFEIYWTKEDSLSKYLGDQPLGDWDRGFHVLVGEDEFRGKHRVKCWLTALAHWAFTEDCRTNSLVLEPRVDNVKYVCYSQSL